MTTIKQLRALAKSYRIPFVRSYNDFRVKTERLKFYRTNKNDPSVRWFILRVQHDFPNATIRLDDPFWHPCTCDLIITLKK